jgi:FkbM family methyltransferase
VRATVGGGEAGRRARRELQFGLLHRVTPVVAVDKDGVRFFVSTRDRGVGLPVFVDGSLDAAEMFAAIEILERSGRKPFRDERNVFVDIGANIGTATIQAIVHHGAHGAVAFEPDEDNLRLLHHNLLANGLTERVTVIQAAVTDTIGPVAFEHATNNSGDHRVRVARAAADDVFAESTRAVTTVPGVTLDSQVQTGALQLDRVALVSIDTQGHEAHVLAGASSLCASDIPVMLEFWPYGLRAAAGSDRLRDILVRSYDRYVDLATPFEGGRIAYRAIDELQALEHRLPYNGWANLLLWR